MNIRNVLYPTDFSSCARSALGVAIELARVYGARLHLLHVAALPGALAGEPMFDMPPGEEALERLAREVDAALAPLVREAEAAGVATVTAHRRGPGVAAAILAYARRHDVGLVVMGTHGRRRASRLLFGSLTEEVLRYGDCSVVSVCEGDAPAPVPRLLLVPFDFSPESRRALDAAADLARRSGARLRLLHVLDGPHDEEQDAARAGLAALHERLQGELASVAAGLGTEAAVRVGRIADEIARASAEEDVGLVVMAAESPDAARRLLGGRTAETVMRTATPPVFLVRDEQPPAAVAPSAGRGAAGKKTLRVMDFMQWEPRVATPDMSLEQAGRVMKEAGCGFLPVVGDGNRVLGVVTDRDLCLALTERYPVSRPMQVRDLLRGIVWSCAAGDDLDAALRTMTGRRVRRLAVLDQEGRLAGILSLDDVVAEARAEGDAAHPSFAQVVTTLQAICRHPVPAGR